MGDIVARMIEVGKGDGRSVPSSRQIEDPWNATEYGPEIVPPPYEPVELLKVFEMSETLRQCVDAMATNIDGFGFVLDPAVEAGNDGKLPPGAEEEKQRLLSWFEFVHPEDSWVSIRRKLRQDYEILGWGALEVIRDGKGDIAGLAHIPAHTLRLCRLDPTPVTVQVPVAKNGEITTIPYRRRFRRYVQLAEAGVRKVYFKEFGDPRTLDASTGEWREGTDNPATEVLFFRQYCAYSPYGVPRWIGALPQILGNRAAAEVNYSYFDNKAIPPMIITVSGGKISQATEKRIQRYIEERVKGRQNFHSVLILEADSAQDANPLGPSQGTQARIAIHDLSRAVQRDALFLEYSQRNVETVRSTFRLPPIYIGLTQDFNRATAEEAQNVAESQVFGPERDEFDFIINRRLLPAMGIRYWRFRSLSFSQDDPERLTEMVATLSDAGLTPREARQIMNQILNGGLTDPQNADWLDEPIKIYLAKLQAGLVGNTPPEQVVQKLLEIRKALVQHAGAGTASNGRHSGEPAAVAD